MKNQNLAKSIIAAVIIACFTFNVQATPIAIVLKSDTTKMARKKMDDKMKMGKKMKDDKMKMEKKMEKKKMMKKDTVSKM